MIFGFDMRFLLQDTGGGQTYLQWLGFAWGWTLAVAISAFGIALLIGSLVGVIRTTPSRALCAFGVIWTELFRNIPLLVQIFVWYHVLPSIFVGLRAVPGFMLVVLALGFFTSARIAEQVRAGIQSLPKGQRNAGLALGLTLPQTYRYVLLPRAFRLLLPPLSSEAMSIIKNSSVAFAVSIPELTMFAMQVQEETSRGIEVYLIVTSLYFLSALAASRLFSAIESRVRVPSMIGKGR